MGEILVITVKRGWERGAVEASNLAYLPQYDRFMGIGNEKGELLEMLLDVQLCKQLICSNKMHYSGL
jgi:hypothetical protein